MIRDGITKLNLTRTNNHLKEIFSSSNYIELGNINYDVLVRLLNYEMVSLEEISYLPIQRNGIGKSTVKNDALSKILPFIFFDNIHKKNSSSQLVITYGLLKLKDEFNREIFSPIVLIPVNIYIDEGKIFIQQVSRPTENAILIRYLSDVKKINIPVSEKLDTIYSIDRFCMTFEKINGLKLELENFFTFATFREQEIKINHERFDKLKSFDDYLYDKLYNPDKEPIYYSTRLNRLQRYAVHSANDDYNLVINGRLGTGKTTTLINIAINAINQGKRVLYVSNMKESLDYVYDFFDQKDMSQYVTNFSNSFASFHQGELIINTKTPAAKYDDYETLFNNYKFINSYEQAIRSRILDMRLIEVINELAMISDLDKKILEVDDLSNLYKHEYINTLNALEIIQSELKKIDSFQNSTWKDIPIVNNIKYPNQIITLIYQVQTCYMDLQKEKKILEEDYGFKEIRNYAYLKIVLHNFKNLNVNDVPNSWKKDISVFDEARDEYRNLKTDLYQLQEKEYVLNYKYKKLDTINIKEEIKIILGDYFTENDSEKIDKINEDRVHLIVKINKCILHIDIFKKAISKIKKAMNWDFSIDNYILEELIKLNNILHLNTFNRKLVSIIVKDEFNTTYNQALKCSDGISKLNNEINHLIKDLPQTRFENVEKTINSFEKYNSDKPVKRIDYRLINNIKEKAPNDFKKILKITKRVREINSEINSFQQQFNDVTGFKYDEKVLENIYTLNEYINGLTDKLLKSKVVKFLNKIDDSNSNKNHLKTFDSLVRAYKQINNLYSKVQIYDFASHKDQFVERLDELDKFNVYIQNLYKSHDRIKSVIKSTTDKTFKASDYFNIDKTLDDIKESKTQLKNNEKYNFLYGKMFQENQTNINNISRLLQAFKSYLECFNDDESTFKSLDISTNMKINEELDVCSEASDILNDIFKIYFKIFKDSVSRFYYNDFESNLIYLNKLLNSKDELIVYLSITENLKILNRYKLEKLIDYIINKNDYDNIVTNFKYTYLTNIKKIYLEKHPYLNNFKSLEACLDLAVEEEDEIIKDVENSIFRNIRRNSGLRFSVFGIKNLDYNSYIRRTSGIKRLFLANTQILNNFLYIKDYDLVIIDDAHLSNADEYYQAIQGNQVIVAGEYQLQSAVTNNLISRLRSGRNINLNYRFTTIPKSLLNHLEGLKGRIYNDYDDNFGIEVIYDNLLEYICRLLKENNNSKINLFVMSLEKQREIYEDLVDLLIDYNYTNKDIIEIITSKINISDLRLGYLCNADYNIICLEDYFKIDVEHIVINMIDNLLLCKKRLIIYDANNYLKQKEGSKLLINLSNIVNNTTIFYKPQCSDLLESIIHKLEDAKFNIYASNEVSFIIRKKSLLYGVIVFWDNTNTYHEILNAYRDYYLLNQKMDIKVIIVWSMELISSIDEVVNRIIKEINDVDNG